MKRVQKHPQCTQLEDLCLSTEIFNVHCFCEGLFCTHALFHTLLHTHIIHLHTL